MWFFPKQVQLEKHSMINILSSQTTLENKILLFVYKGSLTTLIKSIVHVHLKQARIRMLGSSP